MCAKWYYLLIIPFMVITLYALALYELLYYDLRGKTIGMDKITYYKTKIKEEGKKQ